jgi:hypothetical protein
MTAVWLAPAAAEDLRAAARTRSTKGRLASAGELLASDTQANSRRTAGDPVRVELPPLEMTHTRR